MYQCMHFNITLIAFASEDHLEYFYKVKAEAWAMRIELEVCV